MQVAENHHHARIGPRARLRRLAAPIVLLAITTGFFWKLVLTDQFTWLESPDLANQVLPWFQFQAGEWHAGRFPLWDPNHATGQSLIGQAQPGVAYPLNWALFSLPLKNGWIRQVYLHWYFVLIHSLAALFCYLLCRDLKRSRAASVFAGCAFGLSGYIGTTDWPQMLNGAIWAPLVFLFLLRALRGVRPLSSAALAGMFLGVSWLSGHHQIPTFLTLAAAGVWICAFFRGARVQWRVAALAGIFGVFLILTSALQTLPAYEYGKLARRWIGLETPVGWKDPVPYTIHRQFALSPDSLLGIAFPGIRRNADPFIGITAVALAIAGLFLRARKRNVHILGGVALAGLLFSLAHNTPFHGVLYALAPLVEKARSPSMAIFIFHFGIAILSAYGFDGLLRTKCSPLPARLAIALAAVGAFVYSLLFAAIVFQKPPSEDRFAVSALVALLLAGAIYARHRRRLTPAAAGVAFIALFLVEAANVTGYAFPNRFESDRNLYLKKMAQYSDLVGFLRMHPWPWRVDIDDHEIPFNLGDWYGIEQYNGYFASLPEHIWQFELHTPRAKNLLGVGYAIRKEPQPGEQQIFERDGLKVFLNPTAFPRAWAVHQLAAADTRDEVVRFLQDPNFDLRRKAFLPRRSLANLEACSGPEDVRVLARTGNRVELEAGLRCRGLVVLGDSYSPGWQATVDGRPAAILPAYSAIRGVVVEAGKHRIVMRYRPASVMWGAFLTALGVLAACALALRDALAARRRAQIAQTAEASS